jgi:hypothetical protein
MEPADEAGKVLLRRKAVQHGGLAVLRMVTIEAEGDQSPGASMRRLQPARPPLHRQLVFQTQCLLAIPHRGRRVSQLMHGMGEIRQDVEILGLELQGVFIEHARHPVFRQAQMGEAELFAGVGDLIRFGAALQ